MDRAHPASRFRVRHLTETGSTNADAIEAAEAGEAEGLVIVADHQRAGRGRLDRAWESRPGDALLVSVLLRPPVIDHLASIAVGCAAAAACASAAGVEPRLKWPNDLLIGDRKLGGILAEARGGAVVVGLGLNVRAAPPSLGPAAIALGPQADVAAVLAALLDGLEERYAAGDRQGLLAEYRRRCVTIGSWVRVDQPASSWTGMAREVDDTGALLVETDQRGVVRVDVGDVVHLRPAG